MNDNNHPQLNLRKSLVERFWTAQDPRLARILRWMDSAETWMVDERQDVMQALASLGQRLNKSDPRAIAERFDPLLDVLAYMSSSRALRVIEWLDRAHEGAISVRLVQKAMQRQDPRAQLLIDRLQAMRSLSLLGQIFSPQRIGRAIELLEKSEKINQ